MREWISCRPVNGDFVIRNRSWCAVMLQRCIIRKKGLGESIIPAELTDEVMICSIAHKYRCAGSNKQSSTTKHEAFTECHAQDASLRN